MFYDILATQNILYFILLTRNILNIIFDFQVIAKIKVDAEEKHLDFYFRIVKDVVLIFLSSIIYNKNLFGISGKKINILFLDPQYDYLKLIDFQTRTFSQY